VGFENILKAIIPIASPIPNRPSRLNSAMSCMFRLFRYLYLEILLRVILSRNNSRVLAIIGRCFGAFDSSCP
jgi:hypothetical protein